MMEDCAQGMKLAWSIANLIVMALTCDNMELHALS